MLAVACTNDWYYDFAARAIPHCRKAASRPLRMKGHFIVVRHAASCARQHSDRRGLTGGTGLSVTSGILGHMDKNTIEKHYLRTNGKAAMANELDWLRQRGGHGPS